MANKICPFMSSSSTIRYCTGNCAIACTTQDRDEEGNITKTYLKCGFKVLLYEILDIKQAIEIEVKTKWESLS